MTEMFFSKNLPLLQSYLLKNRLFNFQLFSIGVCSSDPPSLLSFDWLRGDSPGLSDGPHLT